MPVTQSAKRALRRDQRRHAENNRTRLNLKIALDAVTKSPATPESLSSAFSAIDRAAKNNLLPKNRASRMKAKFSKLLSPDVPKKSAPAKAKPASTKSKSKKTAKNR